MKKYLIGTVAVVAVLIAGFFILNSYIYEQKQPYTARDYKDAEYVIEGWRIRLTNGEAVTETGEPNTDMAGPIVTKYFGNELKIDLNGDGREDVAFILTQNYGGSGTFFYAVAALNTERGYIGSDGYLLGDRIAPQSTTMSSNPRHKYVVVFNYADRALTDPMTTQPSVGKSIYLKLDPVTMQWGIVEPNFEGETQ